MKIISTFFLFYFLNTLSINAQSIRVLTYNIRYDNAGDSLNSWENRKEALATQVANFNLDILGIQEGLEHQVNYLKTKFPQFSFYGIGRDDGEFKGEFAGIFYKKERFILLKSASFWLSATPEKPSIGWDAVCIRICSYVYLHDLITNKNIWVFNTHFDHIGKIAQVESAKLITKKIMELNMAKEAVVLLGDFNSIESSTSITYLSRNFVNTKNATKNVFCTTKYSYNGFGKSVDNQIIDFIFVSKNALKTKLFITIIRLKCNFKISDS